MVKHGRTKLTLMQALLAAGCDFLALLIISAPCVSAHTTFLPRGNVRQRYLGIPQTIVVCPSEDQFLREGGRGNDLGIYSEELLDPTGLRRAF